jgi:hypothetical protein
MLDARGSSTKKARLSEWIQLPGACNFLIAAYRLTGSMRQHAKSFLGVVRRLACIGLEQLVGKLKKAAVADCSNHKGEHTQSQTVEDDESRTLGHVQHKSVLRTESIHLGYPNCAHKLTINCHGIATPSA